MADKKIARKKKNDSKATPKKVTKRTTVKEVPYSDGIMVRKMRNSQIFTKNGNKAALIGNRLFLSEHKAKHGNQFKEVKETEAKKKHWGFARSTGLVKGDDEVKKILKMVL